MSAPTIHVLNSAERVEALPPAARHGTCAPLPRGEGDNHLTALERFIGAPAAEWAPGGISPFPLRKVEAGQVLICQGAPADRVYVVQAGDFKLVVTARDGYEQVLDFAARSDVLGFDGLGDGHYASGVVALEDAWVYGVPIAAFDELAQRVRGFHAHLQSALGRQIARGAELAWLMAAVSADRRCARFVLHWAWRMGERGQSARLLLLRMSRRDIASHLGLAHESVSRSFSMLADDGLIRVVGREIEILDPQGLERFAACTRGVIERRQPGLGARRRKRANHDLAAAA